VDPALAGKDHLALRVEHARPVGVLADVKTDVVLHEPTSPSTARIARPPSRTRPDTLSRLNLTERCDPLILIGGLWGIPGRTGGRYVAVAILRAVDLEPSPILRALPKSTSPARKDRKVGLDKMCLLMEVRYPQATPKQHQR
jgi:hypothetical protein